MQLRRIGSHQVSAIGLGAMQLDDHPQRAERTLQAALDAGVTLIDTAIAYGPGRLGASAMGENERLLATLLERLGARKQVLIATKGGHTRTAGGGWGVDSSAPHLQWAVDQSLRNLRVEQIDLYQHHRPDPDIPYGDALGTLKRIYEAGKVRMVGISNADPDQIRLARDILGPALVSVQNQYSPRFRSSEPELRLCDELGLAFLPWSPLGGITKAGGLGDRFASFQQVADAHGVSPQQVCLAWMLALSPVVVPIPGSSRPETIRDSAKAVDLQLTPEELQQLG